MSGIRKVGKKPRQRSESSVQVDVPPAERRHSDFRLPAANDLTVADGGTYAARYRERERLRDLSGEFEKKDFEAEHIFGFGVLYDFPRPDFRDVTSENGRLFSQMPAYYETKELHQGHVGSLTYNNILRKVRNGQKIEDIKYHGWDDYAKYRESQLETLKDKVSFNQGTSASNAYQLNQLGYAIQMAERDMQRSDPSMLSTDLRFSTNSFIQTVAYDQAIVKDSRHREQDEFASDFYYLGPKGQAEAVLARETAVTGLWPTQDREDAVVGHFIQVYRQRAGELSDRPPQYAAIATKQLVEADRGQKESDANLSDLAPAALTSGEGILKRSRSHSQEEAASDSSDENLWKAGGYETIDSKAFHELADAVDRAQLSPLRPALIKGKGKEKIDPAEGLVNRLARMTLETAEPASSKRAGLGISRRNLNTDEGDSPQLTPNDGDGGPASSFHTASAGESELWERHPSSFNHLTRSERRFERKRKLREKIETWRANIPGDNETSDEAEAESAETRRGLDKRIRNDRDRF